MIYGVHFSDSLADILANNFIQKYKDHPFEVAKVKIILPTRRSCQSLKEAFWKQTNGKSILLPQMIPLYEMDKLDTDLPPAISDTERLFLLTKLCQAKPNLHDLSKAYQVAVSLAELLDLSYQYQADFSHLEELVPVENFAEHWQETVQFLEIIRSAWPKILSERGQIDKQDKLQRLIFKKANEITSSSEKIIIAGLTADLPSVSALMQSVLKTNGEIFLDGVDIKYLLTQKTPSVNHPQFLIHKTLKNLQIDPVKIKMLGQSCETEEFIQQAFRQDSWRPTQIKQDVLNHMQLILAESAEQEALTIALILRKVLETPEKTATLITPNRTLARRVINQMKRWQVNLDDSAGLPFKHTPTGSFLLQILQAVKDQNNASLLGLYKHPLFANQENVGNFHLKIKNLEKEARVSNASTLNFTPNEKGEEFFNRFKQNQLVPLKDILAQHISLAEKWATTDEKEGREILWSSEEGRPIYQKLSEILSYADILENVETDEYPALFEMFLQNEASHTAHHINQQIKILGPIEGRFTHSDVCILGGLNEQVFPPIAETGPWLNQSMLEKLALPLPQQKITTMAHDFMHALASPEVYLTRATKENGTPTIASRFLERLMAISEVNQIHIPTFRAHLAKLLDTPKQRDKVVCPAPCPPISVRPNKLSATNIELLKRNPYAIYAKYILSLFPLNDLDIPPKASLYGQVIHDVLAELLPVHADIKTFEKAFTEKLEKTSLNKADKLFYTTLFKENILPFLMEHQEKIKNQKLHLYTEEKGEIILPLPSGPFTLTARADRIDYRPDKTAVVIDYKTGQAPSFAKVEEGISPQLPIESLILQEGGFKNIPSCNVSDMAYWKLGRNSKITSLTASKMIPQEIIQKTKEGVVQLIEDFRQESTPYMVCPVPKLEPAYNDYKHLARNAEWQHEEEENDDES